MAVGDGSLSTLYSVDGVRLATVCAGIRYADRKDLVLVEISENSTIVGAFTQNAFCAAPVRIAKRHLSTPSSIRYLLINTGNANAGTGQRGMEDALACVEAVAGISGVAIEQVMPFSTGVIGEFLPVEIITGALPRAFDTLSDDGWLSAAEGIMTTDTRPKAASRQLDFDGNIVTITGIAKGAGMIKPNMATMLSFVATDAKMEAATLQTIFTTAVDTSFNRITVDGDTSTNDACILIATGKSGVNVLEGSAFIESFSAALAEICLELAHGLVRDAEGATKFVSITVNNGKDEQECLDVAYAVAESPLVKTALFASDPNWGRILAAIGRAGVEDLNVDKVTLDLNGVRIAEHGSLANSYTEALGKDAMSHEEIVIDIDLTRGNARSTVWTSDLSPEYVRINAEYRS